MGSKRIRYLRPPPPFIVVLSLLWLFFDRTWSYIQSSKRKGIYLKLKGTEHFQRIQICLWLSRMAASALISIWGANVTEGTYGALLAMEIVVCSKPSSFFWSF